MTASTLPPQQEAVLRMLDTRMACLLVDRPATEVLRRNLFALRDKLSRERLDAATLREVETAVRALTPRQTIDGAPMALDEPGGATARWPTDLMGRALSGMAGVSGIALLIAHMAV